MDIFFQFPQEASIVFLPFFFFLFLIIIFIYLIAPGLSCGTQDPSLQLLVVEFLVVACKLLAVAWGISFPDQGLNLGPLHWKYSLKPLDHQRSPSCLPFATIKTF